MSKRVLPHALPAVKAVAVNGRALLVKAGRILQSNRGAAVGTARVLAFCAKVAQALPGTFMIDEIYSNADGTVQFVEIRDHDQNACDAQENLWSGQTLLALGPAPVRRFVFPTNLPTCATSGKRILIATQSFAASASSRPTT